MSLLNIPTKPRRSFPLASLSVLAKVAKARVAADLLLISEKEVRDLSFPSPTAAPRRATTLLLLPLLLYLPSPNVLPFFPSLPRQRGFSSAWSLSSKATIEYYASASALFCRKVINRLLNWKPSMCKENLRARRFQRYRNFIALLLCLFFIRYEKFSRIYKSVL